MTRVPVPATQTEYFVGRPLRRPGTPPQAWVTPPQAWVPHAISFRRVAGRAREQWIPLANG
jgi:hypothetical protein